MDNFIQILPQSNTIFSAQWVCEKCIFKNIRIHSCISVSICSNLFKSITIDSLNIVFCILILQLLTSFTIIIQCQLMNMCIFKQVPMSGKHLKKYILHMNVKKVRGSEKKKSRQQQRRRIPVSNISTHIPVVFAVT